MKENLIRERLMILPLKDVQKKADSEFQKMRRIEESNMDGVVRCISCGAFGSYKTFDGGHFIPRNHLGTRYESLNVWPQCKKCNKWLHGNHAKYRDGLIKKIGKEGVENLEASKDVMPYGPGVSWREWCIEKYISAHEKIKQFSRSKIVSLNYWPK